MNDTLWWVERHTSRSRRTGDARWHREDGWAAQEQAEASAAFYRASYHAPARIVPPAANNDRADGSPCVEVVD